MAPERAQTLVDDFVPYRQKARVSLRLVPGLGFNAAVSEHEPWLRALALRLSRSPSEADDLVQDTLERALRAWERFEPGTNLRAWLSSILNNLFIDRCRRATGTPVVNLDDDLANRLANPTPDTEPDWAKLGERDVRAAAEQLPDDYRAVFRLHLDGLSYQAIAEHLQIPRATVGTRLLRARRQLKELLTPAGGANV